MTYSLEYWQGVAYRDPFAAVRTGWTERDFDTRTDDSICSLIAFQPGDVVLDYGCGPGYACKLIAPIVRRYVGLDYSGAMLDLARTRNVAYANAEFIEGDGASIWFADGRFDAVFCELVFQHNRRAQTLAVLREILRVLKPGGRAALQFPTGFYGADIGFTVDELAGLLPGWRVGADPGHPEHYIQCLKLTTAS